MRLTLLITALLSLLTFQSFSQNPFPVNLFSHPVHSVNDCDFCEQVAKKNWKSVEHMIAQKTDSDSAMQPDVREWLLEHPCVNYVYPMGSVPASLPSWGCLHIGFKDGDSTILYNAGIKLGNVNSFSGLYHHSNPYSQELVSFTRIDSTNKIWELKYNWCNLFADTLAFKEGPPLVNPPDLYYQAYLGTKDHQRTEQLIRKNILSAIETLRNERDVIGLCLMMCAHNIDNRYYVLKALQELNDPRAIPMLAAIAGRYKDYYQQGSEIATIYHNFCVELANTLDQLCKTNTQNLPGVRMPEERLAKGLNRWEQSYYLTDKGVKHSH